MHSRRHRAEDLEEYQRHREGEQQLAREAFAFYRKRVGIQEKRIGLQDEHGKVELIEENRHKAGDGPIKSTRVIRCDVERSAAQSMLTIRLKIKQIPSNVRSLKRVQ